MDKIYVADDRALYAMVDLVPGQLRVAFFEALTTLVHSQRFRFPRDVVEDVKVRASDEDSGDTDLVIWTMTILEQMSCAVTWGRKREAQGWAYSNGYTHGLDPAIGGRESCIVAVVAYLFTLQGSRQEFCVVTDDYREWPGRAALGTVCKQLQYPTIIPQDFVEQVLGLALA
jgi:hypothetical protein